MQKQQPEKMFRPQLSLTTLLWLVFSAACFFAGMHFDDVSNFAQKLIHGDAKSIRVAVGSFSTINTDNRIPTILIDDPSVCIVTPLKPTTFQVQGLKPGRTVLQLIDDQKTTIEYVVLVE